MAIPSTTTIYGKILPNTSKKLVSNKIDKEIGFKYPIQEGSNSGYFSKSSGIELVRSEIKSLIKTIRGERFMLPDYGCNVRKYLMEPIDQTLFNEIKNDISQSVSKYLGKVQLDKLQVFERNGNIVNIKLFCSLKEDQVINFIVGIDV